MVVSGDAPPSLRGAAVRDALMLALVVFGPALLYLPGLGFSSDDWSYLAAVEADHPLGRPAFLHEAVARLVPIIVLGVVVLGLGYAIFLTNDQFYFSAAVRTRMDGPGLAWSLRAGLGLNVDTPPAAF